MLSFNASRSNPMGENNVLHGGPQLTANDVLRKFHAGLFLAVNSAVDLYTMITTGVSNLGYLRGSTIYFTYLLSYYTYLIVRGLAIKCKIAGAHSLTKFPIYAMTHDPFAIQRSFSIRYTLASMVYCFLYGTNVAGFKRFLRFCLLQPTIITIYYLNFTDVNTPVVGDVTVNMCTCRNLSNKILSGGRLF
jgi:hypothetical protein